MFLFFYLFKTSAFSNRLNIARLKVLQARDTVVEQVFNEAKQNLGVISQNKDKYRALLENLVLQVLAPVFFLVFVLIYFQFSFFSFFLVIMFWHYRKNKQYNKAKKSTTKQGNKCIYKSTDFSANVRQGLFQLMEPEVVVTCRKVDVPLVNAVVAGAASRYQAALHQSVSVKVNDQQFLRDESAGGVELAVPDGRIRCSNTLDSRLELLQHEV